MASLFVSYSRKDIESARILTKAFEGQGLDFWIDWEGIPPTVDWWKEIEKGIEEADIFLFLLSPDSAKSPVCQREIGHAVKNGKRLIPVVVRAISATDSPQEFRHLNWIFLRETDDFDPPFNKLISAIKTDYVWTQAHKQLQVKALEWERSNSETSFLLRGRELQDAELQLASSASKEPHPTELQRVYVLKSRLAATKQRRTTTIIVTAGIIALAVLAIVAFIQAGLATSNAQKEQAASTLAFNNAATAQANEQEAQRQEHIARIRELSAQAELNIAASPSRALLLAVEAGKLSQGVNLPLSTSVQQALHDALGQIEGDPLPGSQDTVNSLQFTDDDKWLLTDSDYNVQVWNASRAWSPPFLIEHANIKKITKSGRAMLALDTNLEIWDFSGDNPKRLMQFTFDQTYGPNSGTQDLYYVDRNGYLSPYYTISDDGRWFGILNANNTIGIIDLDAPEKEPVQFDSPYKVGQFLRFSFSPNADWLVVRNSLEGSYLYKLVLDNTKSIIDVKLEKYLEAVVYQNYGTPNFQFSLDGNWLLVSGTQIELWRIETDGISARTTLPVSEVNLGFTEDSRYLFHYDDQSHIILWRLPEKLLTSASLTPIEGLPPSNQLYFDPESRLALLVSNNVLYLRDFVTGNIWGPRTTATSVFDAQVLPNSAGLVILTNDGGLTYYSVDLNVTRPLGTFPGVFEFSVTSDARFVVLKDANKRIHLLDLTAPTTATVERLATAQPYSDFQLSSDGRWLIAGSSTDLVPRLWDLQNLNHELAENTIRIFPGGQDPEITGQTYGQNPGPSFSFSPNGRWLATKTGSEGELFDLSGSIANPIFLGSDVETLTFSLDNHWLGVSTASSSTIEFWTLQSTLPLRKLSLEVPTSRWALTQVEFSSDGKWLIASTSWQVFVLNWEERTSTQWTILGPQPPTGFGGGGGSDEGFRPGDNVITSPNGDWLVFGKNSASTTGNNSLSNTGRFVWDLKNLSDAPFELQDPYSSLTNNMAFSPDGRWLVAVPTSTGVGILWDLSVSDPNKTFKELIGNRRLISAVAFSPDNRWLATGHGNDVYLWDLTSGDSSLAPRILQGHTSEIWSLAFNPDGQTLASGSRDKTIRLWNMNAANITISAVILKGHSAEVYDIAFTNNGATLVSNSLDGTTRLWNLNIDEMLTLACQKAGRNLTINEWAVFLDPEPIQDICPEWAAVSLTGSATDILGTEPTLTPSIPRSEIPTKPVTPIAPTVNIPATPALVESFIRYTVQQGDTITNIAQKFNQPLQVILEDNNISNPDSIIIGQIILVRVSVTATASP